MKPLKNPPQQIFCHNDFYFLNILVSKETDELKLIDFEYTAMNPATWDLINMICENAYTYIP